MKKPDDDKEAAVWVALMVTALGVLLWGSVLVRQVNADALEQERVAAPRG